MTEQSTSSQNTKHFRYKLIHLIGAFVIGIIVMIIGYLSKLTHDQKSMNYKDGIQSGSQAQIKYDTMQTGKHTFIVKARSEIQIKEQNEIFDEKIKSINDRTGDLYLSLTIIVTLLLVFNIGVFYNASHDAKIKVEKYLNKHIGEYENKVKDMRDNVQDASNNAMDVIQSLTTEYKSMLEMKKQMNNNQTTQDVNSNDGN